MSPEPDSPPGTELIDVSRVVSSASIAGAAKQLVLEASHEARPDVVSLLRAAVEAESSPRARQVLDQLLVNADLAKRKRMPLCQDCGYVSVFVEAGSDLVFDGNPEEALQLGVSQAFETGFLRHSRIVDGLLSRDEFHHEHLAFTQWAWTGGDKLRLTVMPKGGGSDNAGRLAMLSPTADRKAVMRFVLDTVAETGAYACPPLFIGVGVGGSFDSVALLSKKALLRRFDQPNPVVEMRELEADLLSAVNELGIGPAGLGGKTTALGVSVVTAPTHMACLPVAVNVGCNCLRSATMEVRD